MGNQQSISENINDTINSTLTSVMLNSSTSCTQGSSSTQTINIDNITTGSNCNLNISGISQVSVQKPNLTCAVSNTNSTDLQNKFMSLIEQEAESKTSGLSLSLNNQSISSVKNKLVNSINTYISVSNIANSIQNTINNQYAGISKIQTGCPACCGNINGIPTGCNCTINISNISQSVMQEAISNLTSTNTNLQEVINDVSNTLSQSTKSASTGVTLPDIMSYIILFIVLCLVVFGGSFANILKYILPIISVGSLIGGIICAVDKTIVACIIFFSIFIITIPAEYFYYKKSKIVVK
jgi:hypothetical protein